MGEAIAGIEYHGILVRLVPFPEIRQECQILVVEFPLAQPFRQPVEKLASPLPFPLIHRSTSHQIKYSIVSAAVFFVRSLKRMTASRSSTGPRA